MLRRKAEASQLETYPPPFSFPIPFGKLKGDFHSSGPLLLPTPPPTQASLQAL